MANSKLANFRAVRLGTKLWQRGMMKQIQVTERPGNDCFCQKLKDQVLGLFTAFRFATPGLTLLKTLTRYQPVCYVLYKVCLNYMPPIIQ